MYATAHERLSLKVAVPAAHDLRRVHLGMIDAVLAGEGSARVAALAARELDDTVAIVLPAIDLAVIKPRTSERKLAAVRRYVSDCLSGAPRLRRTISSARSQSPRVTSDSAR
jgi:hypothetical protein